MKSKIMLPCKSIFLILSIFVLLPLNAQNDLQENFTWSASVGKNADLDFKNYNCDLEVHTSNTSEIKYTMAVKMTFKNEGDAEVVKKYLDGLKIKATPARAEFDARFWKSINNSVGKKVMELKDGTKVRFKEFEVEGELWIPESCNLHLSTKYSTVDLADLDGETSIKSYNDRIFAGNITSSLELDAKYSKFEFKDIADSRMLLYNTDINANNTGNLKIDCKYSMVNAKNVKDLEIESYNDKFRFTSTGNVSIDHKYSSFIAEEAGEIKITSYNGTFDIATTPGIKLEAKYTKLHVKDAGYLEVSSSYNDSYEFGNLGQLRVKESKYGTWELDHIKQEILFGEGYSDKLKIKNAASSFKRLEIDGKYLVMDLGLPAELDYKLSADLTYPNMDLDWDKLEVSKRIEKGSKLELVAQKGKNSENMAAFLVKGYNVKFAVH